MKKTYIRPQTDITSMMSDSHVLSDSKGNRMSGKIGSEDISIEYKGDYTGQPGVEPTAKRFNGWDEWENE